MSSIIYCFTGTGNSLKIAKDLQTQLGDSKLIRICKDNMDIRKVGEAEQVGFVFPVHGRGLPQMVKEFIDNLQIDQRKYVFAVANYGDYPALSFIQLKNILIGKGVKLAAVFGVPMPGNKWFMYYPHPKQEFTDRINAQPAATLNIAHQIKTRSVVANKDIIANREAEEEWYRKFSPNNMDIDFWTSQNCSGCGICAKICPANNINMVDDKPVWLHQCVSCLACLHWCPEEAIEYKMDSVSKDRYHHPNIRVQELFRIPT